MIDRRDGIGPSSPGDGLLRLRGAAPPTNLRMMPPKKPIGSPAQAGAAARAATGRRPAAQPWPAGQGGQAEVGRWVWQAHRQGPRRAGAPAPWVRRADSRASCGRHTEPCDVSGPQYAARWDDMAQFAGCWCGSVRARPTAPVDRGARVDRSAQFRRDVIRFRAVGPRLGIAVPGPASPRRSAGGGTSTAGAQETRLAAASSMWESM